MPDHSITKNKGLKRVLMAGVYSFNGIKAAVKYEAAFRQELILAVISIPVAIIWVENSQSRVILIAATGLVLITELLNSAVEAVVNRVGPEYHELSGRAKDIGSAAVLLCLLLWAYVWIELFVIDVWLRTG